MAESGEIPVESSALSRLDNLAGGAEAPCVETIEQAQPASDDQEAEAPPTAEAAASDIVEPSPVPFDKLARCEERLHYVFNDKSLLRAALTHASSAEHRLASNERLEFLGDAILGVVTCEMLFRKYPEFLEGDLTRVKSVVVSRHTCTLCARACPSSCIDGSAKEPHAIAAGSCIKCGICHDVCKFDAVVRS